MATRKVILVTGANQGLGFATIKVAANRDPSAYYILACRDMNAGVKAVDELKKSGISASLDVVQLDVTKDAEITKAVELVTTKYGKLDVRLPKDASLEALRASYTEMIDVNVSSVACICAAFQPLLGKSTQPKVINITSGLASITNCLTKPMRRSPPYATTKVALNGLTAHLQGVENERVTLERSNESASDVTQINYYAASPGFLKTAFMNFHPAGADPITGAEVVVQLISNQYPGGTQWEYEAGKMQKVPW
ncbi:hypothetical protein OCU04_008525 [Sclerotinia nivalis]|uniref:NAD(P)-binding protein n=1 Tax=Sclerotinia nivalis TaxID=352851 RepID=A0A9X0AIJ0_9HELO|nr:hypothetical protein OCU04_008525 [Sclerotinia nivalis]